MSDEHETPLSQVPGMSEGMRRRLLDHWITSAEQIVGLASTSDGTGTLARALDVSDEVARELVAQSRAALDPATAERLSHPAEVSRFGLGARHPRHDS